MAACSVAKRGEFLFVKPVRDETPARAAAVRATVVPFDRRRSQWERSFA
jgi:hypothetical protein